VAALSVHRGGLRGWSWARQWGKGSAGRRLCFSWVKIRGKARKGDVIMLFCYGKFPAVMLKQSTLAH